MKQNIKKGPSKGMSLSKKMKKEDEFINQFAKEEKLSASDFQQQIVSSNNLINKANNTMESSSSQVQVMHAHPHIEIEENLLVKFDNEGEINKIEIKGDMKLIIMSPNEARCIIETQSAIEQNEELDFKFRFNPKINAKEFNKNGIIQKKLSSPYAIGNDNATVVAKWLLRSKDNEVLIPFMINFWPNQEDNLTIVTIDYELNEDCIIHDYSFKNIVIVIPCNTNEPPEIRDSSIGSYQFDYNLQQFIWMIPEISINNNETGNIEFALPTVDNSSFYPLTITFQADSIYNKINVNDVKIISAEEQNIPPSSVEYTTNTTLNAKFIIEQVDE